MGSESLVAASGVDADEPRILPLVVVDLTLRRSRVVVGKKCTWEGSEGVLTS